MVQDQTYLFLVFSLTGIIIGFLFDFFRILRKSFKTTDLITCIEDVIFWILTGILILYNIWYFNNGEIRLFIILGIILGVIIYLLTLSNIVVKVFTFIVNFFKKIIIQIFKTLEIPFKPIVLIYKKICAIITNIVKKIIKNGKNLMNFSNKKGKLEKNGE